MVIALLFYAKDTLYVVRASKIRASPKLVHVDMVLKNFWAENELRQK